MRSPALFLCIFGALLVAAGGTAFYGGGQGNELSDWIMGFLGVAIGLGLGSIGLILYLVNFLLRILRHRESLNIGFRMGVLGVEWYKELGTTLDDDARPEESTGVGW